MVSHPVQLDAIIGSDKRNQSILLTVQLANKVEQDWRIHGDYYRR
jgi:hypothetical protein